MDSRDIVRVLKKSALNAVDSTQPTNVIFGKCTSTNPLKIYIDHSLTLTSAQVVVGENLTERTIDCTIDGDEVQFTFDNSIKVDDKLILVQCYGGQKFIVIDRIGG